MCAHSERLLDWTDTTAFAYAGLMGNALIDQLGTDVSRRLLAFSRMVRLEARETLYAPGEAVRHVYFPAGCAAASCGCYGLLSDEYGKFINNLDTP